MPTVTVLLIGRGLIVGARLLFQQFSTSWIQIQTRPCLLRGKLSGHGVVQVEAPGGDC